MLQSTAALTAALRGTLLLAVVVLLGTPPTVELVLYPIAAAEEVPPAVVDRLVLSLVVAAAILGFVAATFLGLASSAATATPSVDGVRGLLATAWGPTWLAQSAVGAGVALAALAGATERVDVPRRAWLRGVAAGGFLVLLAVCASGYSTVVPDARVAIALKLAHMTGAAIWTGGLLALAALAPPVLRAADDGARSRTAARAVRRFSPIAVAGVTLASATGLLIAVWHVPGPGTLETSAYGVALAIKVVLVLVGASLGGVNRVLLLTRLETTTGRGRAANLRALSRVLHGGRSGRGAGGDASGAFVRAIRLELLVLVAVVVLSVVLAATLTIPAGTGRLNATGSEFRSALLLGAIAVAAVGFTTFGYEVTEIGDDRSVA